jgi:hypothetical protein
MKKVVLSLLIAGVTLMSCKNDPQQSQPQNLPGETNTETTDEIALNSGLATEEPAATYLYVTARSGLSLRAFDNLQSKRLARMPYGTRVKVITAEERPTMTVGGIPGGMHKVEFNHKTGYAFNGYLSRYFPPEQDITPKGYASELKSHFPGVTYSKKTGDSVSNPITIETITLPEASWHEAYFVAQQLFDFPKEFDFPSLTGPPNEVVKDSKPKKGVWTSQLEVDRTEKGLSSINYRYEAQKFKSVVEIIEKENKMILKRSETIK